MSTHPMGSRPVCVLVGPPGAGKTTVGQLISESLGVPMRDVDADIEEIAGKSIPEIFIDDGETRFRELEKLAVARELGVFQGILALGGGAVLAEETRIALRDHLVVYLSVELADAIARVGLGQGRPLLTVSPRATLKYLLEQRRPLYEQVATVTVPTDGRTPAEVATEVVRFLSTGKGSPS